MDLEAWFLAVCKGCCIPGDGILGLKNQVFFLYREDVLE
jgi:hypothetical protein